MERSWGPATAVRIATRPADITVIITHPGTSPRSSRAASKYDFISIPFSRHQVESDVAGEEGEHDSDGEDEKDDGDHHRDLLAAARLDEIATCGFTHVGGLGMEDVDQRGAAL